MRAIRVVSTAMWAALTVAGQGFAQDMVPAEAPPADFAGNQFVDSAGCVFMRGEIGGKVAWLARLNRDRQQVCGYDPSLPAGAAPGTATGTGADSAAVAAVTAPDSEQAPADAAPEAVAAPEADAAPEVAAATEAVVPAQPQSAAPAVRVRPVASAARPAACGAGPQFVQVGAFAVPANADRVADRLLALGLRVTIVRERLGRRPIRTVLAGPLADEQACRDAFRRIRQAGFADAFRRRQPVHMP